MHDLWIITPLVLVTVFVYKSYRAHRRLRQWLLANQFQLVSRKWRCPWIPYPVIFQIEIVDDEGRKRTGFVTFWWQGWRAMATVSWDDELA